MAAVASTLARLEREEEDRAAVIRTLIVKANIEDSNLREQVIDEAIQIANAEFKEWKGSLDDAFNDPDAIEFSSPPTKKGGRAETLHGKIPLSFTVFGSANSSDIDTLAFVSPDVWVQLEHHDRIALCKVVRPFVIRSLALFGYSPCDTDCNVGCVSLPSGHLMGGCKGEATETGGAVVATSHLHRQPFPCPLTSTAPLNVGHKVLRVARTTLSMATQRGTPLGRHVRQLLTREATVATMLGLLEGIDFRKLIGNGQYQNTPSKLLRRSLQKSSSDSMSSTSEWSMALGQFSRDDWLSLLEKPTNEEREPDLPKKAAFYIASALGMLNGEPIFTKTHACERYPDLAVFVNRSEFGGEDLVHFQNRMQEFIATSREKLDSELDQSALYFEQLTSRICGAGDIDDNEQ